jgi:putative redox protein
MSVEATDSRVEAFIDDRYRVTSVARNHQTITDELEAIGGCDSEMNPVELLLSAIASCKLSTMRIVADRKNWDTRGMKIVVALAREESENQQKSILHQTISFPEHLTEEQRTKLTAVSHKCPVSKIVTGEVHIIDK